MCVTDIPYEFIQTLTKLNWSELKFGLDHQLLKPRAAIDRATEQVCETSQPSQDLLDLIPLSEADRVRELVNRLASRETPVSNEHVRKKWLFIVLAGLFDCRESTVDPLGFVEEVYADFDYPSEIESFVRYTPMEGDSLGNQEQNEARLFANWNDYLQQSARRFATGS
jgi:hypothetical protein